MKTIEEKAKAYDEALEWMRELYPGLHGAIKEDAEHYFPELAESEDERIRKKIIDIVKAAPFDEEKDVLLDYLEKQKEPEKEELAYRLNGLMQEYIKEGKDAEEKEHRFKCYQLFWDALEDTNFFEQKEQNPAWSEEDERILTGIIERGSSQVPFGEPALRGEQMEWLMNRLKSLRPSWKPSEEDIKMLEHIIGQYETGNKNSKVMGYLPRVEELSFLKKVLSKWKN